MIKWCVEHKKIVILLSAALLLGGVFSFLGLERQENPTITAPIALIQCIYPGAGPEDVEKQIVKPIEKKIGEIEEVKTLESYSLDNVGIVKVTLEDMSDSDILDAWDDVKSKLDDAKADLPDEAEQPTIDTDMAQSYGVVIGLSSKDYTNQDLKTVAQKLQTRLEKLDGVAAVDLSGDIDQQVTISLDMVKLKQYGISVSTIGTALKARNVNIPGGNLEMISGKVPVQITGEYQGVEEIKNTIVGVSASSGLPVYLKNVADVALEDEDADISAMVNNQSAVLVGVRYAEGQNVQRVGKLVGKELDRFRADTLYRDMALTVLTDQADFVQDALLLFLDNLLGAILLVIAVVWLFMGARSAIVVSLPIALVTSVVLIYMYMTKIPIHQVSIASLVISLSLLVANGIVANDNMYLYLEQGRDRLSACVDGVKEVNVPILTSTLTTIASFLPLAMMQGSAGKFASSLPILVSVALLSSYFTALTVVPATGHKILRLKEEKERSLHRLTAKFNVEQRSDKLKQRYETLLNRSLERPKKTILLFLALLGCCMLIVPTLEIQVFPPIAREQYVLDMILPESSTVEYTRQAAETAGEVLTQDDSVEDYACQVGDGFMKYYVTFMDETQGSNVAEFLVNGTRSEGERVAREIEKHVPNAAVHVKFLEINMPQDYPVQIRIAGSDIAVLQKSAEEVRSLVSDIPGVWSTDINYGRDSYKLKIRVNEEKANMVGITNYDVASTVRMAVNGTELSQLKQKDVDQDSIPIVMKLGEGQLDSSDSLKEIFLTSQITGENVPLAQLAQIDTEVSNQKIVRRDEERTITVGLFLESSASSQKVLAKCQKALADYQPPQGYELTYGGNNEFTEETFSSMKLPALLAVALIYLIMVFQFGNLAEPMIIMGTIPLSLIGIIAGLRIMGYPIGFMALLGTISLMGVVVNNGIVLLDYMNQLRRTCGDLYEVVRTACKTRMRPILIGMITTVISLLPLMISGGPLWAPLAASIVFGMLVSTALTLIVIPCAYILVKRGRPVKETL